MNPFTPLPAYDPTLLDAPQSMLHVILGHPLFKAGLPIPAFFCLAPAVYWVFRRTWHQLDRDAQRERGALLAEGKLDLRVPVAFVMAASILTLQEYYGGRGTFEEAIRPLLQAKFDSGWHWLRVDKYKELYTYAWWAFARIAGYVIVPLPIWKLLFPGDRLVDMGLRMKGFSKHLWIYGLLLVVVIPAMLIVAKQPDFGSYYPFYKQSSRSYYDLVLWEAMYFGQFFALEIFFRGWWLNAMRRSLGSGAIFAMAVPYCMIHYGKPYLEANGAIIAGIVLGSLSMRTRSIYAGFLVHITVALSMDLLALHHRHMMPTIWFAPNLASFCYLPRIRRSAALWRPSRGRRGGLSRSLRGQPRATEPRRFSRRLHASRLATKESPFASTEGAPTRAASSKELFPRSRSALPTTSRDASLADNILLPCSPFAADRHARRDRPLHTKPPPSRVLTMRCGPARGCHPSQERPSDERERSPPSGLARSRKSPERRQLRR